MTEAADQSREWWFLWWPFLALFVGGWVFLASRTVTPGAPTLVSPTSGPYVAAIIWLAGFTPVLLRLGRPGQ